MDALHPKLELLFDKKEIVIQKEKEEIMNLSLLDFQTLLSPIDTCNDSPMFVVHPLSEMISSTAALTRCSWSLL